jgi:hypothetical protein
VGRDAPRGTVSEKDGATVDDRDQSSADPFLLDPDPRAAFQASLTRDLELLTARAPASRLEPQGAGWKVPDADLAALRSWGVPIVPDPRPEHRVQLAGDVQHEPDPQIATEDGTRAYAMGTYWRMRVGAIEHTGTVVGVRTAADAASFGDSVVYINSGVTAFLETAWRWAYASNALRRLPAQDYDHLYDCLDDFRAFVHRLDPATDPERGPGTERSGGESGGAGPGIPFPFWDGIIEGW